MGQGAETGLLHRGGQCPGQFRIPRVGKPHVLQEMRQLEAGEFPFEVGRSIHMKALVGDPVAADDHEAVHAPLPGAPPQLHQRVDGVVSDAPEFFVGF